MILDIEDVSVGEVGKTARLAGLTIALEKFQALGLVGHNGSGKSAVIAAIRGKLLFSDGVVRACPEPEAIAEVSFNEQRALLDTEMRNDNSDFLEGGVDHGTTVRDFLSDFDFTTPPLAELFERLGLAALMGRGLKYLSSGEFRKVLFFKSLGQNPAILVLESPTEALDTNSRKVVSEVINDLLSTPGSCGSILFVAEEPEGLPGGVTAGIHLSHGRQRGLLVRGPEGWSDSGEQGATLLAKPEALWLQDSDFSPGTESDVVPGRLVEFRQVNVVYDGEAVLENVNFTLGRGEHTMILGPNGCGKTTMLRLITGENPQVYANHVEVCSYLRGSGESVWDVRARLASLSSAFHMEWLRVGACSTVEVVVSGFYDSIGLYRQPSELELRRSLALLGSLGLGELSHRSFPSLSWGEQRSVLLARALVKSPWLLILDEPCHGLDRNHRDLVLQVAALAASRLTTTLLQVSHDPDEILGCTRKVVHFEAVEGQFWPSGRPHYRIREEKIHGFS